MRDSGSGGGGGPVSRTGKKCADSAGAADQPADGDQELTLEVRLRRLDEIIAALEGGGADLERGLALFEEGVRHIRQAEGLLARAELRVHELVGDSEARELRPFEDGGE
ncbi:MAG: exodeoxyribonuclease VII small subunit [Gemmatimonadetes bacterium]|nr:exodeoxyribonuclease VII small subunit [Gemmatimonadota bacterium]